MDSRDGDVTLLRNSDLLDYLAERQLISGAATATTLAGGVSNVVVSVTTATRSLVVKQSLPRLRVASEWLATRSRLLNEAECLRIQHSLTPQNVPRVISLDETRFVLVIEAAPPDWVAWKSELLAGRVNPEVASRLGEILATWHSATTRIDALPRRLRDTKAFDELRVDPFYRELARRHPELALPLGDLIEAMRDRAGCLVHGDYSPKNVLVGASGLWVIDAEVAHYGDPTFDVAFLICHLTLKAIRDSASAPALNASSARFVDSYLLNLRTDVGLPKWQPEHLRAQVGALLLARVEAKSPVDYLDTEQQIRASELGRRLLTAPDDDRDDPWRRS